MNIHNLNGSYNNSDYSKTFQSKQSTISNDENNKDNNIGKNKNNQTDGSIFNCSEMNIDNNISENMKNITDKEREIDNNINNKKEVINNSNNNNNFLKERVESKTKFDDEGNESIDKPKTPLKENNDNIDMNISNNHKEENTETKINGITPIGDNIDNNQGSINKAKNKDVYQNFQFLDGDLEMSQSVILGQNNLEQSQQLMNEGYLPIFMKLDDYKPLFFFIKEESTLKSLLKMYIKNLPETDMGNEVSKLYVGKKLLDKDKQIQDLDLSPYSIITNKKG